MRFKADLTLFFISIIWGSAFVAQRVAGQVGSVYIFNGVRYLLAGLVVLPFAWRSLRANRVEGVPDLPRAQYKWMFIAGFLLFIGSALQQTGMLYTTAGNAGFITSLYVVLIPILLFFLFGEKPHWLFIVAIVLAMAGAFLLSTGGKFEGIHTGDLLEIIGALFWAFHVVVLGKYAHHFESMTFSVGQLLVCGLVNLGIGLVIEPLPVFDTNFLFAIGYTAFLSLGLCYTLQIWAQKHTPPADAALLLSLESVFAVISGWLLLDERLAVVQIIGCVMIFGAVLLSQFKEWTSGTIDTDHLVEGR
ncbi:MAG TPA: DMT family transporter [Anaerolineales bacterium]|nr:DMT family transporter [Anaerolineales bacterium]HNA90265.1 DMT family transporter [Anaerolineales bacterium]HNB37416.1 DMT family transporter [Anaerolineales bacterium]